MKERLFLVDAYALIFKSYYAFLSRPMRNREGLNTSAIFGFTKFIRDIIKNERPHYMGVAFDPPGGSFRNQLYPQYKANRSATPEDIIASVPYIKQILEAMRIPVLQVQGYEADDVIGTLSGKASRHGFDVYMVTPDKDYGQLVGPSSFIYKQGKGGEGVEIVDCSRLKEQYGVDDPGLIADILAIWGDASDNIPGVRGIGEKGAVKLVSEWGSVENIIANADKLPAKQRDGILASVDQLMLSKRLATIDLDVPVDFSPQALAMEAPDCEELRKLFAHLDFRMFLRDMDMGGTAFSGRIVPHGEICGGAPAQSQPAAPAAQGPPDLFSQGAPVTPPPIADLFSQPAGHRTIADTPHTYHTITEPAQLEALIERIVQSGEFCFDTETTGFDPFGDKIIGVSFCIEPFEAWYLPLNDGNRVDMYARLAPLFADESIAKVGQNIKFDIMMLRGAGIRVLGPLYDTMILHYLLDPDSRHGMDSMAAAMLDYAPIPIESLIGRGAKQITMDMAHPDKVAEYGAEDADVTMRLKRKLWPMVVEQGFERLYRQIEEPLIAVLADMELAGVKVDTDILSRIGGELNVQLAELQQQICEQVGQPSLNINSARQLGVVLFEKLRIDPKPKMTATKQYRTDEEYLSSLADRHPAVGMILEYRGVKKLLSTYVEALPRLVNGHTGRVHTSYNQAVASTGRLSSANPNLQNIPIRDAAGREIRRAFVPASSDYELLSADYSQVELRLMAHISGDEAMIEAFRAGEDIHAATAARIFGVEQSEVTPEQRRSAKTVNFGIIYGISPFGLAQRLGIARGEAARIIDGYFASYPGVRRYMEQVIARAREEGFVTTLFGRRRPLPDIRSSNANVRSFAERNAINAPLQGSAADIIKLAMVAAHRELAAQGLRSRIIMQVHDELVVELFKPERDRVTRIVVDAMQGAASLKVTLVADYGIGDNWLEAH